MSDALLFLMVKTLQEQIKNVAKTTADAIAHATGGAPGPIAAAVWAIAVALIEIAYTVAITAAIINLITQCQIFNIYMKITNIMAQIMAVW